MIESAYLELKAHNAAFQLAMATSIAETAAQNPNSEYHVNAMIHEMDCQETHQNAMIELETYHAA